MNNKEVLIQARNRALASDINDQQRALCQFFQHAIDDFDSSDAALFVDVSTQIATWYTSRPPTKEQ